MKEPELALTKEETFKFADIINKEISNARNPQQQLALYKLCEKVKGIYGTLEEEDQ